MKRRVIEFLVLAMLAVGAGPGGAAIWQWSLTPGNNATADPSINWAEGMSPSSVNDSARAMMSVIAAWRQDISGFNQTAGTSTAYTLTSSEGFDTAAHMSGAVFSVFFHAQNGINPTLNVDGVGAFPIRTDTVNAVPAGAIGLGSGMPSATVVFSNPTSSFILQNYYNNIYNIPLGAYIESSVSSPPNSNFVAADGRCISRTTYAAYFSLVSTTYGVCDGTTTFGVPDRQGRVPAMLDGGTGRLTNAATGCGSAFTALGATCANGTQSQTLVTLNLPPYTPSGTIGNGTFTITTPMKDCCSGIGVIGTWASGPNGGTASNQNVPYSGAMAFTGTPMGGASQPLPSVQPTYGVNVFVRVL